MVNHMIVQYALNYYYIVVQWIIFAIELLKVHSIHYILYNNWQFAVSLINYNIIMIPSQMQSLVTLLWCTVQLIKFLVVPGLSHCL